MTPLQILQRFWPLYSPPVQNSYVQWKPNYFNCPKWMPLLLIHQLGQKQQLTLTPLLVRNVALVKKKPNLCG